MERFGDFDGDELTRLLREIAQTCGSPDPDSGAVHTPEAPRGIVLPPAEQVEMALDQEYYEQRIVDVQHHEDGSVSVMMVNPNDDDDGFPISYQHAALDGDPPEPGETIRFYGQICDTVRGISIGDRTYFYTPKPTAEDEPMDGGATDLLDQAMDESDAQLEFAWRADTLPWPMRKLIITDSRKYPDGHISSIALQRAENALRIISYFDGNEAAIRTFSAQSPEMRKSCEVEMGLVGDQSDDTLHKQCDIALWCVRQTGWNIEP